jgi:acyl-CoA synthetase (AMP-forming)/AMP-acid ligase II
VAAGVGHNVGLLYAKTAFSYAAIIAIMRSGNVYVPLNPKLPSERLLRIIEDAGIKLVIIDTSEGISQSVLEALQRCESLQIIAKPGHACALPPKILERLQRHRPSPVPGTETDERSVAIR